MYLQAPSNAKLPVLFLLDSITKNAKEPFIQIFSRNLPQVRFWTSSCQLNMLDSQVPASLPV